MHEIRRNFVSRVITRSLQPQVITARTPRAFDRLVRNPAFGVYPVAATMYRRYGFNQAGYNREDTTGYSHTVVTRIYG